MRQSNLQSKNTVSTELEQLVNLKNVGRYQLLKEKNTMTQELNVPELTNNNLILMRQLLDVTQEELASTMGINEKTIRRIENKEQGISERFVDNLLSVYPDLAQSIEVQFD
ncbi:UNVERIFIED_ORG: DNA-binding XRE family transcriptional regulator [Leuconostoc holzapfelii]